MSIKLVDKLPKGLEVGGKYREDPMGSTKPRGKSSYRQKHARDLGLTPTEHAQKQKLMKQFCKLEGPGGNSEAYVNADCWCRACGNHLRVDNSETCDRCA